MSDIFISYARKDLDRVRSLARALSERGWSVFWDRTIPAGKTWRQFIGKALEEAKCVLVVWSHTSVESQWVLEEADEGRERRTLIPIRIDDVRPPLGFRSIQGADLFKPELGNPTPEFEKLVEDISTMIGSPAEKTGKKKPSHKPAEVQMPQPPEKNLEPRTVFRDTLQDGSPGPEMVVIPPGRFEMGDLWGDGADFEKPVHAVHITRPFALGRYPVTFEEYDKFATATGWDLPDNYGWGRGRRPVIKVEWEDAVAYAAWLSQQTGRRYRLPSEAEWEYAARSGGKEEKWAGTSAEGELGDYAWYTQNSGGKTQPVGEKKPNGLGLYDMSGNVWEWVQDIWHDTYQGAPDDGSTWGTGDGGSRVIRGGSWLDDPRIVRSAYRLGNYPVVRVNDIGFRLAQDL